MLWSFSPIALLLFAGIALVVFRPGLRKFLHRDAMTAHTPTAGTDLLAVAPTMTGAYLLVQALILDIQETPK